MVQRRTSGLVSVVVTTWNRRNFILQCLNRLYRQTYRNIEVIVVDDGSTDGTVQVVSAWKRRLPAAWQRRICIVPLPRNTGYSGALTTGMFLARGEFIATHDSDDLSHPRRIAEQVRYLRQHRNVGLIGTNYRILQNGRINERVRPAWLSFGIRNIRQRYAKGQHCVTCGSLMLWGTVFDRIGGLNRRIRGAEDYEFVDKAIRRGVIVDNLPQVLYYVRSHPAQRSHAFYG